jgi:CxxC motif-containing protein (DUF1111 family)
MHDLKTLYLENAIERHKGEDGNAEQRFDELTSKEREALITFLKSL